jgi:hypothetical protein
MASASEDAISKLVGVYEFQHPKGSFIVHLRTKGRFFAPKYQVRATWNITEVGELSISWGKYGNYEMEIKDPSTRYFEGNAVGDKANWRKVRRARAAQWDGRDQLCARLLHDTPAPQPMCACAAAAPRADETGTPVLDRRDAADGLGMDVGASRRLLPGRVPRRRLQPLCAARSRRRPFLARMPNMRSGDRERSGWRFPHNSLTPGLEAGGLAAGGCDGDGAGCSATGGSSCSVAHARARARTHTSTHTTSTRHPHRTRALGGARLCACPQSFATSSRLIRTGA